MDKRIVYTRADGGCSVVTPAPHGRRFVKDSLLIDAATGEPTFRAGQTIPHNITDLQISQGILMGVIEDDGAFLARLVTTLSADAKGVRVVDVSAIPIDRTFRNAWRNNAAGKPEVDMPAARELWRDKMRRARGPKLAALDVEYQRADEAADAGKKAEVVKRKQLLRDVTDDPRIEAAKTPDDLKAVWPAELD